MNRVAGVSVTRFWKAGSVDYKRVVELRGVDLQQYRGRGGEEIRVSVSTCGRGLMVHLRVTLEN